MGPRHLPSHGTSRGRQSDQVRHRGRLQSPDVASSPWDRAALCVRGLTSLCGLCAQRSRWEQFCEAYLVASSAATPSSAADSLVSEVSAAHVAEGGVDKEV